MTRNANQIADLLNTYAGWNIWSDIIDRLDEYDPDATDAAGDSSACTLVLTDGSRLEFNESTKSWEV